MKHGIFRHFIRVMNEETGGEGSTGGSGIPAPTGDRSFSNVGDAVAELERRERARREANKQAKAQRESAQQGAKSGQEDGEDAEDDAEDGEDREDARKAEKDDKKSDKKPKNKPSDDDGDTSDDEGDDDVDADDDSEDDEDDPKAKRKQATDRAEDDNDEPPLRDDEVEVEQEGKKYRVPKALEKSFLLHADYTRKTQEVAQERKVVEAAMNSTHQAVQRIQAAQQALVEFAVSTLGEPPNVALAEIDPGGYIAKKAEYDQRVVQIQQLMQQGQQVTAQQQQIAQQQHAQFLREQTKVLLQQMPELSDAGKRAAFRQSALSIGEQYGFSADEIGAISDHRMMLLLRDFARLSQSQASRQSKEADVRKKLANVPPKSPKPRAGGNQKALVNASAKQQFMKSGRSMRDVAKYLDSLGD